MDTLEGKIEKDDLGWPNRIPQKGSPWTAKMKKTTLAGLGGAERKSLRGHLGKVGWGTRMPTKERKTAKTGSPKDPQDVNFQSRERSKDDKTRGLGMHWSTQKRKSRLISGQNWLKKGTKFGHTIPKSRKTQKTHEETIKLHENLEKNL